MGAVLVPIVIVVVVVGFVVAAVVELGRRQERGRARALAPEVESVRYRVPEGQDPAAVLTALRGAGIEAAADVTEGAQDLVVPLGGGVDRERLRAVIADAPMDLEGDRFDNPPVRFTDE